MVTTFAGHKLSPSEQPDGKDGNGQEASFRRLYGICINPNDECIYVCDELDNSIRKVTMEGIHDKLALSFSHIFF